MTNTIPNVPRELLADLLGNDHDKRIMAERHLLAMLANAPAVPAADAGMVEALEKLARLGNGDKYGNSDGNLIAQAALAAHRANGVV